MKKVLVATDKPFAAAAVKAIQTIVEKAGYGFLLLEKYKTPQELHEALKDANAVIIRSDIIDKAAFEAAPNLEIVIRAGAGYDNIDLAEATKHNVVVMNTPGQNSNAVAELVFGMMVYMARNKFDGSQGSELRGKTLGLHAFGNVGRYVALIAKGFGMDVYAYDPFLSAEAFAAAGVTAVKSVEELYEKSQYISLHIPATAETKNSINLNLLSRMPKGATLVNTARKEVINEAELLQMFEQRPDFKYLTDVEPGNAAALVEKFAARYYTTPKKMGAQTNEANNNAGIAAANQIHDFFEKKDVRFQVNK